MTGRPHAILAVIVMASLAACGREPIPPEGTATLRAALFDSILARTERREEISRGLRAGDSRRSIARRLGRAASTASREIAGNGPAQAYRAWRAERRVIRRFSSRPFRTTFGNLRLSDAGIAFANERLAEIGAGDPPRDAGVPETMDDGSWLRTWLATDVADSIAARRGLVQQPFKLAHAPKDSDGILRPAPVHFRRLPVALLGPHGRSHLDQFAAILKDNGIGYVIGMPAGGYSNTWEWQEILTYPGTERPVISFMWSIGHTLRPSGEVLEGNPALPDEVVPLTRHNFLTYYDELLRRALTYLTVRRAMEQAP